MYRARLPPSLSPALALALLFAAAASQQRAAAFSWEACDADTVPFKSSEVQLDPDPAIIGKEVTFTIKGTADRDVAAGAITMDVAFTGVPIYAGSDDLCTKTACPIAPGPVEITYVQELPPIAPPGDYDVTLKARDAAGAELLCVAVHFSMVPPPSAALAAAAGGPGPSTAAAVAEGRASSDGERPALPASRRLLRMLGL